MADAKPNGNGRKFDMYKYLARSVLLPIGGIAAVVYLIHTRLRGADLKLALISIGLLVGVFNASELLKTWIDSTIKKGGTE